MKREQIVSYFFIGLFLFIVYQLFLIFSPFLHASFWAAILAFAFYPLYQIILRRVRMRLTPAALITTVLIILIITPPLIMVLISLVQEATDLYRQVSDIVARGDLELTLSNIKNSLSSEWQQKLWHYVEPYQQNLTVALFNFVRKLGTLTGVKLVLITKNVFFLGFNLFLIGFLLFFFLRDGERIYRFLYDLIPMEQKNKKVLANKMNETFSAVIRGQLLTAIAQGTLTGLTFWMLGLPVPLLVGFATFLSSMIPVTGAATVWGPFAIYLFLSNEMRKGLILLAIGALVISVLDNVLKPFLIGEKTKLPVFLLFLGMLGGLKFYGLTGIFLGPVVLSLFFVLVKIYHEEYKAT